MAIIGLPYFSVEMPLFDLQARFFLTFMTHMVELPSKKEMLEDTKREMNEKAPLKAHFLGVQKHADYYEDLANAANIERLPPVIASIFNKSITNLFEDYNNFRRYNYKIIDDDKFLISEL